MTIEPTRRPVAADSRSSRGVASQGRTPILLASCLVAAILGGCGEHDEPPGMTKKSVAFNDVPESVREAARKALPPGVKIDEAWQNLDREAKLHSYELRGRNASDGKIREVRVSLTGEILESE